MSAQNCSYSALLGSSPKGAAATPLPENGVLAQLLDGAATVAQDRMLAVDVGDFLDSHCAVVRTQPSLRSLETTPSALH